MVLTYAFTVRMRIDGLEDTSNTSPAFRWKIPYPGACILGHFRLYPELASAMRRAENFPAMFLNVPY